MTRHAVGAHTLGMGLMTLVLVGAGAVVALLILAVLTGLKLTHLIEWYRRSPRSLERRS